jgi:hypothetical protein
VSRDLAPGETRFIVPGEVIETTEAFLRERGRAECEAVVLWFGVVGDTGSATVSSAYVPEQTPFAFDDGVGVYIDEEAITRVILALAGDEIVLARIHSHPRAAYHSDTDDLNRLISHEGAISIVVPYFASRGLRIELCSVNEFLLDLGWQELSAAEAAERIVIR